MKFNWVALVIMAQNDVENCGKDTRSVPKPGNNNNNNNGWYTYLK